MKLVFLQGQRSRSQRRIRDDVRDYEAKLEEEEENRPVLKAPKVKKVITDFFTKKSEVVSPKPAPKVVERIDPRERVELRILLQEIPKLEDVKKETPKKSKKSKESDQVVGEVVVKPQKLSLPCMIDHCDNIGRDRPDITMDTLEYMKFFTDEEFPDLKFLCAKHYKKALKEQEILREQQLTEDEEDISEHELEVIGVVQRQQSFAEIDVQSENGSSLRSSKRKPLPPPLLNGCWRLRPYSVEDIEDLRMKNLRKQKMQQKTQRVQDHGISPKAKKSRGSQSSNPNVLSDPNFVQQRVDALRLSKSGIHSWGMFAKKPICKHECIIEYIGEKIRNTLLDSREKEYEKIGSDYFFRLDEFWSLDATIKGGVARFINHTCDPNCFTRIIQVNGFDRVFIYALRDIDIGEELSYDYKFEFEEDKSKRIKCRCGTKNCRGYLN